MSKSPAVTNGFWYNISTTRVWCRDSRDLLQIKLNSNKRRLKRRLYRKNKHGGGQRGHGYQVYFKAHICVLSLIIPVVNHNERVCTTRKPILPGPLVSSGYASILGSHTNLHVAGFDIRYYVSKRIGNDGFQCHSLLRKGLCATDRGTISFRLTVPFSVALLVSH